MPIVEQGSEGELGTLTGVLINPDNGKMEGFFMGISGFLSAKELFFSSLDVIRWGNRITISSRDVLSPVEERIRLQALLKDSRTVLRQRIKTESGTSIGRCMDIQFDTESMRVEWIFPKKFWKWGTALPISEVVVIRKDAIIIRDPHAPVAEKSKEKKEVKTFDPIPELSETTV